MRYPGFRDISAVLTLILTHEYSLEWEFDNICMALASICFDGRIKIRVFDKNAKCHIFLH